MSNEAIVRELFDAWNAHDVARAERLISDQCNSGGLDGFRKELAGFFTAFPDQHVTIEDIFACGDKVATRTTIRGTHQGSLFGIPATGKPVVMKANHIFRCEGGKIVQRHGQLDRLEVMMQLGMKVVPT
jgi:steroid delta-isomerase-like uncharacterized protein